MHSQQSVQRVYSTGERRRPQDSGFVSSRRPSQTGPVVRRGEVWRVDNESAVASPAHRPEASNVAGAPRTSQQRTRRRKRITSDCFFF